MLQLIALRIAMSLVSLVLAAAFAFSLVHLSPTDPAVLALGDGASQEQKLALTRELGLDQPILVQLWTWASRLVTGDLGQSIFAHKPVLDMIGEAIPVTLSLLTGASVLAVIIGLSVGAFAGLRAGSWADRMVTSGVSGALAMPSFWLALLLGFLFAVKLRLVPVAGYTAFTQDAGRWAIGLILPCFALSVHGAAVLARHMRGAVIDVMDSTFINAARARGTSRRRIVLRYVLKNSLVPVMPVIGIEVAVMLAISPVIEKVFVLPGMGMLMVNAVITSDFPLLQGTILVIAAILIAVNFLVDIALGLLDPRIRPQ
jgi:peptide/nickel transport system permease protein